MVRMVYRVPIFFIQDLLKFRFHDIISNTDYTIFFLFSPRIMPNRYRYLMQK